MSLRSIFLLLILLVNNSLIAQDKLLFAIDMIRHGDRTPLRTIDKAPHDWKEGMGQLTAVGMHEQFELGKHLRKKYVDEHGLLSAHYHPQDIYVRSTDFDRTLMSAQCLLMGLYPVGTGPLLAGYQPIPIHSQLKAKDDLIPNEVYLDQFKEILVNKVFKEDDWQLKTAQISPKWSHWSEASGLPINSLRDVIWLADILYIHQLHQAPLPPKLTAAEIAQIIEVGKWGMAAMYKSPEVGDLLGQNELIIINRYLQDARLKQASYKYVLLSAHDSSILSLMSALRVPLEVPPPYAAHVSFQLFEKADKSQYILVKYNDQKVNIPACGQFECAIEKWEKVAQR